MKSDDDSAKPKAKSKGARLHDPLGVMYEQDYRDYLLEFDDEWQTEHKRRAAELEKRIHQGIEDPNMPVPRWVAIVLILPFLLVLLYALLVRFL